MTLCEAAMAGLVTILVEIQSCPCHRLLEWRRRYSVMSSPSALVDHLEDDSTVSHHRFPLQKIRPVSVSEVESRKYGSERMTRDYAWLLERSEMVVLEVSACLSTTVNTIWPSQPHLINMRDLVLPIIEVQVIFSSTLGSLYHGDSKHAGSRGDAGWSLERGSKGREECNKRG